MTLTLAQYRTAVLALLDDASSERYTSDQIDAALKLALIDYSSLRPIPRTYYFDTTGDKVMELPADFAARQITRVQAFGSNDPNSIYDLDFIARLIDEQWTLEIIGSNGKRSNIIYPAGDVLVITYADFQSIDGLNGAVVTTIDDDNLICMGAAGYAAQSRSVSRSETINMQPAVQRQLMDLANQYFGQFFARLHQNKGLVMAAFGDMPADE